MKISIYSYRTLIKKPYLGQAQRFTNNFLPSYQTKSKSHLSPRAAPRCNCMSLPVNLLLPLLPKRRGVSWQVVVFTRGGRGVGGESPGRVFTSRKATAICLGERLFFCCNKNRGLPSWWHPFFLLICFLVELFFPIQIIFIHFSKDCQL